MSAENDLELYYSLEVMTTANAKVKAYVFFETGLTNETIYNDDDFILFQMVEREVMPEPLNKFLMHLASNYPALMG